MMYGSILTLTTELCIETAPNLFDWQPIRRDGKFNSNSAHVRAAAGCRRFSDVLNVIERHAIDSRHRVSNNTGTFCL